MKVKRIVGLMLTLAMLLSCAVVSYAETGTVTESYSKESYTTSGNNDYMEVDLDQIFTTGNTYKISFNAKPQDVNVMAPLQVTLDKSDTNSTGNGLVFLYDAQDKSSFNIIVGTQWKANMNGFRDAIGLSGVNVEMLWNTVSGEVKIDTYLPWNIKWPYSVVYPENRIQTQIWNAGKIENGKKYGKLKIGSPTRFTSAGTKVDITDMKIRNINTDPLGKYETTNFKSAKGEYKTVALDEIIKTGNKYEIKWNMKPSAINTAAQGILETVDIIDCDNKITTSMNAANGNHRGLVWLYTQNNGLHGQGLANWSAIGDLTAKKDAIIASGIDVKLLWDTEVGHVYVKLTFGGDVVKTYEWNPGKISGRYGYLLIGSETCATDISGLSIKQVANIEAPILVADDIKIFAGETEQAATVVTQNVDSVKVDFKQAMYEADMIANNIYVKKKNAEVSEKIASNLTYANGVCTLKFTEKLVPGETYTIVVNKLRNAVERWTTQAYTKDFTVIESGVHADITGIIQNGETITSLANLTAGAAKANVSYTNDTGKNSAIYLIAAYYKNNRLVIAQLVDQDIENSTIAKDYEITFNIPEKELFDKVSIMVWDGLGTLVPLSESVDF